MSCLLLILVDTEVVFSALVVPHITHVYSPSGIRLGGRTAAVEVSAVLTHPEEAGI